MSKKEISCNITDTELVKLNIAISSIKLAQDVIAKGTNEHTNAIAVTVANIYEIVSNDRGQ